MKNLKLKDGFITYETDGEQIMVATGSAVDLFHGIVRSNRTAAYIIECLKKDTSFDKIVNTMANKFDAPKDVIENDVKDILKKLRSVGVLDE